MDTKNRKKNRKTAFPPELLSHFLKKNHSNVHIRLRTIFAQTVSLFRTKWPPELKIEQNLKTTSVPELLVQIIGLFSSVPQNLLPDLPKTVSLCRKKWPSELKL